jgi:hypothetical protein
VVLFGLGFRVLLNLGVWVVLSVLALAFGFVSTMVDWIGYIDESIFELGAFYCVRGSTRILQLRRDSSLFECGPSRDISFDGVDSTRFNLMIRLGMAPKCRRVQPTKPREASPIRFLLSDLRMRVLLRTLQ